MEILKLKICENFNQGIFCVNKHFRDNLHQGLMYISHFRTISCLYLICAWYFSGWRLRALYVTSIKKKEKKDNKPLSRYCIPLIMLEVWGLINQKKRKHT